MYKLTIKNYILISLVIIAIISLLLEDTNFIRLIITKIISLSIPKINNKGDFKKWNIQK